jgi:hypothetical protein
MHVGLAASLGSAGGTRPDQKTTRAPHACGSKPVQGGLPTASGSRTHSIQGCRLAEEAHVDSNPSQDPRLPPSAPTPPPITATPSAVSKLKAFTDEFLIKAHSPLLPLPKQNKARTPAQATPALPCRSRLPGSPGSDMHAPGMLLDHSFHPLQYWVTSI